ncbi:MAG: DUF1788 domain-containing protein [Phycisphaerales bacterium]
MGRIEDLADVYHEHVNLPWQSSLAGAQRVLMVVYDKHLERTLRARLDEFRQRTISAGHRWQLIDMTTWFSEWLSEQDYREAYFEDPDALGTKVGSFTKHAISELISLMKCSDANTVVGVMGTASLYGFMRLSELINEVEPYISGRLLVFFPGVKNGTNYRLLDARDGWNYLATGITLGGQGGM